MVSRDEKETGPLDLHAVIDSLRAKRKIFHSEADFQFALAWEIQLQYRTARVRLEYPWGTIAGKRAAIDILVTIDDEDIPIELKYAKRNLLVEEYGEVYDLHHQGAKDRKCYMHINDLCRVERFVKLNQNSRVGYVLWLINDLSFTKPPKDDTACYFDFSIHEGAELHDTMQWGDTAGPKTRQGCEEPLVLNKRYKIHWQDYSSFEGKNGLFKYALIKV